MATAPTSAVASATRARAASLAVEQRALVEQVVAGVGREPELREGHQHRALGGGLAQQRDGLVRVEARIGDLHAGHGDREARKAVPVGVKKSSPSSFTATSWRT